MLEQQEYIGTYIGGYRLTAQLAASSSSFTFLGETASLTNRQLVVVKWYHAVHLIMQQEKKDFLREASMLKRLQQPFILPILSAGLFTDTPYIVTPYMSKGSFYDRTQDPAEQPWLQEHAFIIIKHIGQALAYSHQQKVVHGKLHARNILFNECDEVQLVDFQLTSLPIPAVETPSAPVGTTVGQKLEYYPGVASKENDQRALGCIAHELLTGCKPLTNQASDSLFDSQDIHVEEVIRKAMASEPSQRYDDISAFLEALDLSTKESSSVAATQKRQVVQVKSQNRPTQEFFPATATAVVPSMQSNTSNAAFHTDTDYSLQTPTLPLSPRPAAVTANSDTTKTLLVPISQQNSARGDIIKSLFRDQGSLFLLSGILCIIIFSIIGTQSATMPHAHPSQGQRAPSSSSTAVESPSSQPTPSSTANTPTSLPTSIALLPPIKTPVTVKHPHSTHELRVKPSLTPSRGLPAPFTVTPAYLNPKTCEIKRGYYTCTVTLILRASYHGDQSWYSSSNSPAALVSPSNGFITQGSQMPITIQIASDCSNSGTITFIGSDINALLTWSC